MSIKEHPPQGGPKGQLHVPVLLESTLELLDPKKGESYLDLTAGYGGHAAAILEKTENVSGATLVDRDENAIRELLPLAEKGARVIHSDFSSAAFQLIGEGKHFDMILADLGVSSPQLDQSERGFSFQRSGPLDMRMNQSSGQTAADLVNQLSKEELADIIHRWGEEPFRVARQIAQAIVETRPLLTTEELKNLIEQTIRRPRGHIHPATRTFQALRIATNDELGQIEKLLIQLPDLLTPGGRVAIISFHSLEDRLVKRYFASQLASGYEADLAPLTKKPIDGATYDVNNPRARSAKLRAAVKL
jgi:16S rRNA (cytosine1402-N4)-methyltransferase